MKSDQLDQAWRKFLLRVASTSQWPEAEANDIAQRLKIQERSSLWLLVIPLVVGLGAYWALENGLVAIVLALCVILFMVGKWTLEGDWGPSLIAADGDRDESYRQTIHRDLQANETAEAMLRPLLAPFPAKQQGLVWGWLNRYPELLESTFDTWHLLPDQVVLQVMPSQLLSIIQVHPSMDVLALHQRLIQPDVPERIACLRLWKMWADTGLAHKAKWTLMQLFEDASVPPEALSELRIALLRYHNPIVELQQLAQHKQPDVRGQAVMMLGTLETPQARTLLGRLTQDPEPRIARMAQAAIGSIELSFDQMRGLLREQTIKGIERVLPAAAAKPDMRLVPFLLEAWTWARDQHVPLAAPLERTVRQIVAELQGTYLQHWPDVFCTQCLTRATVFRTPYKTYVEYRIPWLEYAACRTCHDVRHLRSPVTTVIGRLSLPQPPDPPLGLYYVHVWDAGTKTALSADINVLEILPADATQPLDWPIAALLQRWQDSGRLLPSIHLPPGTTRPWTANTDRLLADAGVRVVGPDGNPVH